MHCFLRFRLNVKTFNQIYRQAIAANTLSCSTTTGLGASHIHYNALVIRNNLPYNKCRDYDVKLPNKRLLDIGFLQRVQPCCWKSTKGSKSSYNNKNEESDEEEDDADEEDDSDYLSSKDSKILKLGISSLRTDLLLKASMNTARNKVEALFYESKIRLNGKKLLKKSSMLNVGDEVDVVHGPSPDNPEQFLVVTRIKILSTTQRTPERLTVKIRRYPKLTVDSADARDD